MNEDLSPKRVKRKFATPAEAEEARRIYQRDRKRLAREGGRCNVDIAEPLAAILEAHAVATGQAKKEIVQAALESYFKRRKLI